MTGLLAQIEFEFPARLGWLALLLLVGYFAYRSTVPTAAWRRIVSWLCRTACVVLLVLAAAGLADRGPSAQRFVVFVTDVSRSTGAAARSAAEFITAALEHRGPHEVAFLDFAGRPGTLRSEREAAAEEDKAEKLDDLASDPAAALELALASIPTGYVPQVVLLTDGNETQGELAKAGWGVTVPISVKPLPAFAAPEAGVAALVVPTRAAPGSAVPVDVIVQANRAGRAEVEVHRDGQPAAKQAVALTPGENHVRLQVPFGAQPSAVFEARLQPAPNDFPPATEQPDNNRRRAMVFADRRIHVLLADPEPPAIEPLRQALAAQGFEVTVQTPDQLPKTDAELARFDLIMLSDVVPTKLAADTLTALDRVVRQQGRGLIVLGGEATFGEAAYRDSQLERLLPVKAAAAVEVQQKNVLALVLVIDKSSSMEEENRMPLAKEAAKQSVQVLQPHDKVGVMAFSNEATWVAELGPCDDKPALLRKIDTLAPYGQTHMYQAVDRAFLALQQTDADRRHVVLLTDGIPAPGDYSELAQRMAAAGITVSTVSLGKGAEQAILQDMARLAQGRHHACEDAAQIPQILVQETKTVAGEAARREFVPFTLRSLPGLDIASVPPLGGYAATSPKPNVELLLIAAGGDPLLAWWRYGEGVTVAFTADAKDRWAQRWRTWPGFGPFWQRLARHATPAPAPDRATLRLERRGTKAAATLDVRTADGGYDNDAVPTMTLVGPDDRRADLAVTTIGPGRYQAAFTAARPGAYVVIAALPDDPSPSVPRRQALLVDYPDELHVQPTNEPLLRSLAAGSGGSYDPAPAAVFAPDERTVDRVTPLWSPLVLAALLLWIADVALRRLRR